MGQELWKKVQHQKQFITIMIIYFYQQNQYNYDENDKYPICDNKKQLKDGRIIVILLFSNR